MPQPDMITMAIKAANAIGVNFAAIDIITDQNGNQSVLEINSNFSLQHFAYMNEQNKKAVMQMYDRLVAELFAINY